ncbi:pentapeptide repeat-containing protein [Actinobacillus equuli]|uniref:pentapeptide repeat-containing protein n=1 Tax=Actinobacillus equuli TaxID=718 RepID=UPI0009DF3B10
MFKNRISVKNQFNSMNLILVKNQLTLNVQLIRNNQFHKSQFHKSQFHKSQFHKSQFRKSRFHKSRFHKSQFRKSRFHKSQFRKSQFLKSQFHKIQLVVVRKMMLQHHLGKQITKFLVMNVITYFVVQKLKI